MELSIFEVLGPVMIGPSSSHTAGAVRLARVAAEIASRPFARVEFGLSDSFAKTGRGHGTDKALIAGVLGCSPDDERIRDAARLAAESGVDFAFHGEDLSHMHENSVHITFIHGDGGASEVWGSSLGGGRILISRVGGFDTDMSAESPTLIVRHTDKPGVISDVSSVLAMNGINIAVLRLSRSSRGRDATATIVVDGEIPARVAEGIRGLRHVEEVIVIDVS